MTSRVFLGRNELRGFVEHGYLVVPGVVPKSQIVRARQAINSWIATDFDRAQWHDYDRYSFGPEIQERPEIAGLLTDTPVLAIAEKLVGHPLTTLGKPQIALRFPIPAGEVPPPRGGHIDGLNDNKQLYRFTVLAGVLLSDIVLPGHGNFNVWPGSHERTAAWFRQHGTRFETVAEAYRLGLGEATAPPTPVCGRAGDLILSHYLLLHGAGAHTGPDIRYTVFFRLLRTDHDQFGDEPMVDPWLEWNRKHFGIADDQ